MPEGEIKTPQENEPGQSPSDQEKLAEIYKHLEASKIASLKAEALQRGENVDNIEELGQDMANLEGVQEQKNEQGPEHLDFVDKGLEKEVEMIRRTKGKAKLLASFALAASLLGVGGCGVAASRGIERVLNQGIRSTERVLTTGMREQGRTERDVLKNERDIRREELRKEKDIYRETERTKQRLGSDEIRKERDIGTAEVRAAERTGTYIPSRGGSVETEETPSGARSTVRPDYGGGAEEREYGEYSSYWREKAEQDWQRKTPMPDGAFYSLPRSAKEAYGSTWNNLERNAADPTQQTGKIYQRR